MDGGLQSSWVHQSDSLNNCIDSYCFGRFRNSNKVATATVLTFMILSTKLVALGCLEVCMVCHFGAKVLMLSQRKNNLEIIMLIGPLVYL